MSLSLLAMYRMLPGMKLGVPGILPPVDPQNSTDIALNGLNGFSERRWYRPIYCEGWQEEEPIAISRSGSSRSFHHKRQALSANLIRDSSLDEHIPPVAKRFSAGPKRAWNTADNHHSNTSTNQTAKAQGDGAGNENSHMGGGKREANRQKREKLPIQTRRTFEEIKEPTANKSRQPVSQGKELTFYIGGGNGVALVEHTLLGMGWKRTTEKYSDNFKLKWVETKSQINYGAFREGEQLVNRIPNCSLLTNKLGLLNSLERYDRLNATVHKGRVMRMKSTDFLPETYRLDDPIDRQIFLDTYKEGETWICKPTGMNQGKGIYLVRELEQFKKTLEERDEKLKKSKRPGVERIVQRYIQRPLLLEGRKFDVRCYMLIASTIPYLVLYHKGYVRRCLHDYKVDNPNLVSHLTNQFVQKKDSDYKANHEETVWSMDMFNDYVNEKIAADKGLELDWVYNTFTNRMKQIMTYCFNSVKNKLKCRVGYFDLYGLDFMVDEDMKISLIEINSNPCLATNCSRLKEIVPEVVNETLYLTIECADKVRRNKPLFPLQSLQTFQILYKGNNNKRSAPTRCEPPTTFRSSPAGCLPERPMPLSPVRRARSHSPVREINSNGFNSYTVRNTKSTTAQNTETQTKTSISQVTGGVQISKGPQASGSKVTVVKVLQKNPDTETNEKNHEEIQISETEIKASKIPISPANVAGSKNVSTAANEANPTLTTSVVKSTEVTTLPSKPEEKVNKLNRLYIKPQSVTPRSSISPSTVGLWSALQGLERAGTTFNLANSEPLKFRMTHVYLKQASANRNEDEKPTANLSLTPGRIPVGNGEASGWPQVSLTGTRNPERSTSASQSTPYGDTTMETKAVRLLPDTKLKVESSGAKYNTPTLRRSHTIASRSPMMNSVSMATATVTDLSTDFQMITESGPAGTFQSQEWVNVTKPITPLPPSEISSSDSSETDPSKQKLFTKARRKSAQRALLRRSSRSIYAS